MIKKLIICFPLLIAILPTAPASANDDLRQLFGVIEEVIENLPSDRGNSDGIEWNDAPSQPHDNETTRKSKNKATSNSRMEETAPSDYKMPPQTERARLLLQAFQEGHRISAWYLCAEASKHYTDRDVIKWCTEEADRNYILPIFALGFMHFNRFADSENYELSSLTKAENLYRQAITKCEYEARGREEISDEIEAFQAAIPDSDLRSKYSADFFFAKEGEACMRSHTMLHSILNIRSSMSGVDLINAKSLRKEAFGHLRIAADMGDADAMHSVSRSYFRGAGVNFSLIDGIEWEQKAIAAGYNLGRSPTRDLVDVPLALSNMPVLGRPGIDDFGVEFGHISYCLALNSFLEDAGPRRVETVSPPSSQAIAIETVINGKHFSIHFSKREDHLLITKMQIGGVEGAAFSDIVSILGAILHGC